MGGERELQKSHVSFVGITGSGKTHALTLLAITGEELQKKGLVNILYNEKSVFGREPLPIREYTYRLRMGEVLEPTPPEKKVLSCEIILRFPGLLFEKTIHIMPIDIAGELLRVVMELIPDVKTIRDLIKKIQEKTGMTLSEEDVQIIRNHILSAHGYILVFDAPRLVSQESVAMEQAVGLGHFMEELRNFRREAGVKEPLRGVAILLTKVDQLIGIRIESGKDVENFVETYAPAIKSELEEARRNGAKIGFFYSRLNVFHDDRGKGRVYVTGRTPVYSREQYERLIFWIKDTF